MNSALSSKEINSSPGAVDRRVQKRRNSAAVQNVAVVQEVSSASLFGVRRCSGGFPGYTAPPAWVVSHRKPATAISRVL